ncbi:unnamed protein product [Schistosoma bovis]|nr:unnamed protein product [Schistosoma bovis]
MTLLSVIHAPSIRFMLMTTAIVFFVTCAVIGLLKLQWNEDMIINIQITLFSFIEKHLILQWIIRGWMLFSLLIHIVYKKAVK